MSSLVLESFQWGQKTPTKDNNTNNKSDAIAERKGRKEMFYLTTHSTHFIYGYMASYICKRTIQIGREETNCHHYMISIKGFYIACLRDRIAHTTAFVTLGMEHWLEWEIVQWVHYERSIWQPLAPRVNALTTWLKGFYTEHACNFYSKY